MIGETLGSYRISALLGEGGMGRVYRAEHVLIGRKAAVKVLLPELSSRTDVVERFFNEARALASLRHPGLVDVLDFGQNTDGSAYLVMELLEGEPLSSRLEREGRLPLRDALEVARQTAAGIGAAHRQGIVHRDLKPENVYLTADPEFPDRLRVKILDFGIAKLSGEAAGSVKTGTNLVMGTPRYMSPEQCRGGGEIDHRTDIYALGCVLFHMLCGRPPFVYDAPGELIAAHLMTEPPAPRSLVKTLPPAIDLLVLRALAKKADDRFADMAGMAAALGSAQASLGSTIVEFAVPPDASGPAWASAPTTLGGSAVAVSTRPEVAGTAGRRRTWAVRLAVGAIAALTLGGLAAHHSASAPASGKAAPTARPSTAEFEAKLAGVVAPIPSHPAPLKVDPAVPPATTRAAHRPFAARARRPDAPAESKRVRLTVVSLPAGAEIVRAADGRLLGTAPLTDEEPQGPGRTSYLVRLPGYAEARISISTLHDTRATVILHRESARSMEPRPALPARNARPARPSRTTHGKDDVVDPFD